MEVKFIKWILILVVSSQLYGCETMKNIDRTMYSVADSMTEKDKITGKRVLSNSRSDQKKMGDMNAKKIIEEMNSKNVPYNNKYDAKLYQRVVNIFDRVQRVSHLKGEYWTVVLVGRDEFNAFVTGGTYIFVYSGLASELNDDELAAVMGHELAHVSANHVGERMAHMKYADLLGSSTDRDSFKSSFTHEGEEEADRIGILYSALAGFDPYAAYRVWKKKYEASGDYLMDYVDHPVYSERAQSCKDVASKVEGYYTAGLVNDNHEQILKNNPLYSYKNSKEKTEAGKGGGFLAVLNTALESSLKHQAAKAEEARQRARVETLKAVNNLIKVKSVHQKNTNQWVVTIHYTGNRNISGLKMSGALYNNKAEVTRWSGATKGYLSPSKTYEIIMDSAQVLPQNTKFDAYIFKVTEVKVI